MAAEAAFSFQRGQDNMATVKELKATSRPGSGKGAARAERRAGRVPGVIYGDNKPPLPISVDRAEIRQRIYAGHFLTTIHEVEVDGTKHRVIPRDFQLDPIKDVPIHVDFMRLGEGAQVRVRVPIHIVNADQAPGVKRGGTVNLVTHTIDVRCPAEAIPAAVDVDVAGLDLGHSKHLSDIALPAGVKALSQRDLTLVTIVAPSGYLEEQRAAQEAAAAAAASAAAAGPTPEGAPAAPGAAPGAAAPAAGGAAAEKK
jgi:large subunit ribosomal protein L25